MKSAILSFLLLVFTLFAAAPAVLAQSAPVPSVPPTTQPSPPTQPSQPGQPGQPVPQPPERAGAFFENIGQVGAVIKAKTNGSLTNTMFTTGITIALRTITPALYLGGALSLLFLVIKMILLVAGAEDNLLNILIDVGLPAIVCVWLIQSYETRITQFAGPGGLLDLFRQLGGDPSLILTDLYGQIFSMIGRAFVQAFSHLSALFSFNLIAFIAAAVDLLVMALFALFIIYLCLTGLAEIAGLILVGPFLCATAVAFGPLFVASIVNPWTRDYFVKWVHFLVASAVLTGVLGVALTIATAIFAVFDFTSVTASSTPTAVGMAIAAILISTVNSLVQQAPGTANALVPGSTGVIRGSGSTLRDAGDFGAEQALEVAKSTEEIIKAVKRQLAQGKSDSAESLELLPAASNGDYKYPLLAIN